MSTFMAKAHEIERKWYIVDAEGKSLGRVATVVADLLRGKNEPIFTPHVDCGNHVIVINADKAVLTGKKLDQKFYYRHTGYIGGLKAVQYKTLMATKPEKAMELAVKGMVPDTTIGRKALTRLRVYKGAEHKHEAQKPVVYEF
ncbi:MAG: 50S ribosomal protein L13 [Clostridia bacterium]|nr:50S ribosomal protein L13 [Clostridia bacterium]